MRGSSTSTFLPRRCAERACCGQRQQGLADLVTFARSHHAQASSTSTQCALTESSASTRSLRASSLHWHQDTHERIAPLQQQQNHQAWNKHLATSNQRSACLI